MPDGPFQGEPQRLPETTGSGQDLKRADDAEKDEPFDPAEGSRAAFDMMDRIGLHAYWHEEPRRRKRFKELQGLALLCLQPRMYHLMEHPDP